MPDSSPPTREQALAILRRHGIRGAEVYLIDLIPLVEMIWADGKAQESEVAVFEEYLVSAVRLSSSDAARNEELRESLLAACVDIAASSVATHPYAAGERFDEAEKRSFFEILESIERGEKGA
jgi:hypothetical protein